MTQPQTNVVAPAGKDTTEERTLVIERLFDASCERVYNAWTEPAQIAAWWGPQGFSCPEHKIEAREGGDYSVTMSGPAEDGGYILHTVSGRFVELSPHSRVVFTWAWEQEDGSRGPETVVTVAFEEQGGQTLMKFEQRLFADKELRDKHNFGWTSSFLCLDGILS